MSDYGYYGSSEKRRRRRRYRKDPERRSVRRNRSQRMAGRAVVRTFDIVMVVLSVVCTAMLIMACMAKYIDPNQVWIFAFPALVFPVLYICEVLLTLYWIIRWKVYAVVMGIVVLVGLGDAGLFFRPSVRIDYSSDKPSRREVKFMSYNVMNFDMPSGGPMRSTAQVISEFVRDENVAILCMQEFPNTEAVRVVTDAVLEEFPYAYFKPYDLTSRAREYAGIGHAVYSKYPIVRKGVIRTDSVYVRSVWCDVKIGRDTLRIISNHLQNTSLSGDDRDFLMSRRIISDSTNNEKFRDIIKKLRSNYCRRATQAGLIAAHRDASPYKTVICGDFNDTPLSYVYHTVRGEMTDAFVDKGKGGAGTYLGFFNMFRIDYVFTSEEIDVKRYYSYQVQYSDHAPVAIGFELSDMI